MGRLDYIGGGAVGETTWDEVANMTPSGDELDRLCDQFPPPPEWYEEDFGD